MRYSAKVEFHGDGEVALGMAHEALMRRGFRLLAPQPASVRAESPPLTSIRGDPALGAGRLDVVASKGRLVLRADMGGLKRLNVLVALTPSLICGCLAFGYFLLEVGVDVPTAGSGALRVAIAGLVFAPYPVYWLRKRTRRALRGFLLQLAQAATPGEE